MENNLKSAIELYLEDIAQHPETIVEPVSGIDLIEFIKDTQPEWYQATNNGMILRPNAVNLSAIALILLELSPRSPILTQWSTTNEAPHTN